MIVYLKKLWKKKIKDAWHYSYFINISGRQNKFVPDNSFEKTIIILNEQKINPSTNIKSNEFFQKTIL